LKNFFGYIRVSTIRQGERGVSLPEQREAIERYAMRNGLHISSWFEEQQTAAKRGRPVWAKMLKLLRLGNACGVMIHKIDRSARNLKDWADLGELIDAGIEVHFANESLDLNSRGGRLSADIQAVVAADYIRNLREEAKKGIYGRLKQGFYPMRAPIGYLDQGQGKAKTIDPVKGALIRRTFELYCTTKFSIPELCDEMFRMGIRNHASGRVSQNGMSTILRNPFYMGVIRIRRTNQLFSGNHEPLISRRVFEQAQDILDGRLTARPEKHDFLFRKLVKCHACGYSLIGEIQKGHVYYRCHTAHCPATGIREEIIENTVSDNLRKLELMKEEKEYLAGAIAHLKRNWIEERERQITNVNIRLQQVSDRLQRLTDVFLDQAIERNLFEERKAALLFERQEIQEGLRIVKDGHHSLPEVLQKFLELAGDAYSLYQSALPEKKRELLKTVSSNLAMNQKSIDFTFAIPFREVAEREKILDGRPSKGLARTLDALLVSLQKQLEVMPGFLATLDNGKTT
jgi:site-specific DNA recombinase